MSVPSLDGIQPAAIINAHSGCARTAPLRETHRLRGDLAHQAAKADAPNGLCTLLVRDGAIFLVVSSPAVYVNEWASFSTRDFPENRDARDGDRVRIVMLDVPDDDCPWRGIKHR